MNKDIPSFDSLISKEDDVETKSIAGEGEMEEKGRKWSGRRWSGRRWSDDSYVDDVMGGDDSDDATLEDIVEELQDRISDLEEALEHNDIEHPEFGGRRWSGRRWSGRRWSGRKWSGRKWSGRRWSADGPTEEDDPSYAGRRWSGRKWSGRRWSADDEENC